jgi:ribosomal protein S18 acetylase RimI-like enzyme
MDPLIREFLPADYSSALALWKTDGIEVAEGDSEASITRYLYRNKGLSKVAVANNQMIAAVLCGHDGRRGLIYHLAVAEAYRNQKIGSKMIDACLADLRNEGIERVLILVDKANPAGLRFWTRSGWEQIDQTIPLGINL